MVNATMLQQLDLEDNSFTGTIPSGLCALPMLNTLYVEVQAPPTMAPTIMPSAAPSVKPTLSPILKPSMSPTRVPTSTLVSPAPSQALSVEFQASQIISGITYDTYMANQDANNQVLLSSIAACMTGITTDDISQLTVTAASRRLRKLMNDASVTIVSVSWMSGLTATTSDSISASYVVATSNPSLSYSTLSSQLATAVSNGTFAGYLTYYGTQVSGGSDLVGCTSSPVSTSNVITDNDDNSGSNGVNVGLAVGLSIGLFAFCVCASFAAYYFYSKSTGESSSSRGNGGSFISYGDSNSSMNNNQKPIWTENVLHSSNKNKKLPGGKSNRANNDLESVL
jgi:hypothetical protein